MFVFAAHWIAVQDPAQVWSHERQSEACPTISAGLSLRKRGQGQGFGVHYSVSGACTTTNADVGSGSLPPRTSPHDADIMRHHQMKM